MDSKLEYWFFLTKIAVVVLDVMILKMASASTSQRLATRGGSCGMLVIGSFFYLPSQTRKFSKVQFAIMFGFSNAPDDTITCSKYHLPIC
jgi:uncharacterized membrane protein